MVDFILNKCFPREPFQRYHSLITTSGRFSGGTYFFVSSSSLNLRLTV